MIFTPQVLHDDQAQVYHKDCHDRSVHNGHPGCGWQKLFTAPQDEGQTKQHALTVSARRRLVLNWRLM